MARSLADANIDCYIRQRQFQPHFRRTFGRWIDYGSAAEAHCLPAVCGRLAYRRLRQTPLLENSVTVLPAPPPRVEARRGVAPPE